MICRGPEWNEDSAAFFRRAGSVSEQRQTSTSGDEAGVSVDENKPVPGDGTAARISLIEGGL